MHGVTHCLLGMVSVTANTYHNEKWGFMPEKHFRGSSYQFANDLIGYPQLSEKDLEEISKFEQLQGAPSPYVGIVDIPEPVNPQSFQEPHIFPGVPVRTNWVDPGSILREASTIITSEANGMVTIHTQNHSPSEIIGEIERMIGGHAYFRLEQNGDLIFNYEAPFSEEELDPKKDTLDKEWKYKVKLNDHEILL